MHPITLAPGLTITAIRITLVKRESDPSLLGFAKLFFGDALAAGDFRVIADPAQETGLAVFSPCRLYTDACPRCHSRAAIRARFCSECGVPLAADRPTPSAQGRMFCDTVHFTSTEITLQARKAILFAYLIAVRDEARQPRRGPASQRATA